MKNIAFVISTKLKEKRRAILPKDLKKIKNISNVFIESGYGHSLGYTDLDYSILGCKIAKREQLLTKEIICDLKIGDANYIEQLKNQTLFGWIHAVQNKALTNTLVKNKLTAYAWEDMFKNGKHIFYRNNEIAGEAAVIHAYLCYGKMPYETKVAILGRGNTAKGALKILQSLGAEVTVYNRQNEGEFRKELDGYDVIVNAVLWDISRQDHLIYKKDLSCMKKNALIIDISCDKNGAIESSVPTSLSNPVYILDGVMHYAVDHTPALFYKTASKAISKEVSKYIDILIEGKEIPKLANAKIIENGKILDNNINVFQNRN